MRYLLGIMLMVGCLNGWAQQASQDLRGRVVDGITRQPVSAAAVTLQSEQQQEGTVTDESGVFYFENIPVGRYQLLVQHVSYDPKILNDILVEGSREKVITITLYEKITTIDSIVISAPARISEGFAELEAGMYVFDVEQTQRFAGTFYDPGRAAFSLSSVQVNNDQANHMVIRGYTPNAMGWSINGLHVVNPNHLTNAGTLSDRFTYNGGGVNTVSTQLLEKASLYSGFMPAGMGNRLSGAMDIQYRHGNRESVSLIGQISLLGIEGSVEGPIEKGKSDFLVNYRYSTVGLISRLGVDVGDELINYNDLAMHVTLHDTPASTWNIFANYGSSSNDFEGASDSTQWEITKDQRDIAYQSLMFAAGTQLENRWNERWVLQNGVAWSMQDMDRTEFLLQTGGGRSLLFDEYFTHQLFTYKGNLRTRWLKTGFLEGGVVVDYHHYKMDFDSLGYGIGGNAFADDGQLITQPYLRVLWPLSPSLQLETGVHGFFYRPVLNDNDATDPVSHQRLDPRLGIRWQASNRLDVQLNYSWLTQLQAPPVYFFSEGSTFNRPNINLRPQVAERWNVLLAYTFSRSLQAKLEGFYDRLNYLGQDPQAPTYSTFNLFEGPVDRMLTASGKARVYGAEAAFEQKIARGYYYLISGTVYESEYRGNDGMWLESRFNGRFSGTFTGGKEFYMKQNSEDILGVNLRLLYSGGFRLPRVDETATSAARAIVFRQNEGFLQQLPNYFRTDLRIYWKRNRLNYTRTWSIDLQNLTGYENPAFPQYNLREDAVEFKYQLGIIPNITYRVEF